MKGLLFDSPRALAVALGMKVIPDRVAASPVKFGLVDSEDPRGPVLVDVEGVPADVVKSLVQIGAKRTSAVVELREAALWPAIVPPEPAALRDELVLFATSSGEAALNLATELLVQGCERLEVASHASGALIRASRPSHYVVLKALEGGSDYVGYAPAQPGNDSTYVELGFSHAALAGVTVEPPDLLLVRGTGAISRLTATPFRPVWDHLDLELTRGSSAAEPLQLPKRRVRLRLARAVTPKPATLWVVRERATDALDRLVDSSPEELLRALSFAAWGDRAAPTVVLRSLEPLSLQIDAEAYAQHAELADVFVPVDRRVHPPVWADRLRAAVGGPDDQLRWLVDDGVGMKVETLPLRALAPLVDWVELVAEPLLVDAWKRAVSFEPDAFEVVYGDVVTEKPRSEREPAPERSKRSARSVEVPSTPTAAAATAAAAPAPTRSRGRARAATAATVGAESDAERELHALEATFRESEAPLAASERGSAWLELARLYDATNQAREAAICRARLVFERGTASDQALADWLAAARLGPAQLEDVVRTTASDPSPTSASLVRLVAALAALAAARTPVESGLLGQAFAALVDRGNLVCVRSQWVGMRAVVALSGDDSLALARARDQLFGRLEGGMSLSRDLPRVVRTFDADLGDRRQALSDVLRFFETTTRTRSPVEAPPASTLGYVRLVLAIAMARTGDSERAIALQREATQAITKEDEPKDPVHGILLRWFEARIIQALEGDPESAPLPAAALLERDKLDRLQQYKVDRVRQSVKLLEPDTDLDPFKSFGAGGNDPRTKVLRKIHAATHLEELAGILDEARRDVTGSAEERIDQVLALLAAMGECPVRLVAPRLSDLEGLVLGLAPDAIIKIALQALPLTERFDTPEASSSLVRLVESQLLSVEAAKVADVAGRLARGARSLRRHPEAATLHATLLKLSEKLAGPDPASAIGRLGLARALAALGHDDGVGKTLTDERGLLQKQLAPAQRLGLIRALAATAAAIRATDVVVSLTVEWAKTTDSYNTNSHLCLSAVELADAIASALVPHRGDALSTARRLADEDEWAVRSHVLSEEDSK
jgi:hypothetical protein